MLIQGSLSLTPRAQLGLWSLLLGLALALGACGTTFVKFYQDPFVLFGDELPDLYH